MLDKIIEYSLLESINIKESFAAFISKRVFNKLPTNHSEFRSPCGAGIGQIVYDWNGNIYPCDESRMLAVHGDFTFKLGKVDSLNYKECISNNIIKGMCASSLMQCNPPCNDCVFLPICGLCPVYNYSKYNTLQVLNQRSDYECNIKKSIFKSYFLKVFESIESRNILMSWANE